MGSTMDSDESSDGEDREDSISEDLSDNEDPERSLDYLSPQGGTSRSPVSTPRENTLPQDGGTQRRVEKVAQTREWDEGKVDIWSNEPSRPERESYDRDFPDLSRDTPKNFTCPHSSDCHVIICSSIRFKQTTVDSMRSTCILL